MLDMLTSPERLATMRLALPAAREPLMDIAFSPDDEQLRQEVRGFLTSAVPPEWRFRHDTIERQAKAPAAWIQQALHSKGWSVPNWPVEYGGPGWTPIQQTIFHVESARAGAPLPSQFGPIMIGPVIYTFGTEAQKAQHLPGIRDGSVFWCQGYSEPGAGSDLASLKTRAVRDGNDFIVNGQKIWTTQAQWADWIFCLVRTDSGAKAQQGISFLLIDMKTPGITVRPIISIDGLHHLNEVFFSDVRVPADNLIGEVNQGWTYAKFLLANERAGLAGTAQLRVLLDHLRTRALDMADGAALVSGGFVRRLSDLSIEVDALEALERRALCATPGSADAATLAMPLKVLGTTLQQRVAELGIDLAGPEALPLGSAPPASPTNQPDHNVSGPVLMEHYLFKRAATVYGGTSEVQRAIIAKAVLGL
jgi:alkylation response protein AidB-like acyl-CoA dehydrogenase